MRQDVIARQVAAMRAANLDAIVSISPENFAYVIGFLSPTQPIMRWRHAMALVTADGAGPAPTVLDSLDRFRPARDLMRRRPSFRIWASHPSC